MQTETSGMITVVSLPVLLILGWALVGFLTAYGAWKRSARFLSTGIAGIGFMILMTPLAWYLYAASLPSPIPIGAWDVVILGVLAFLGGGVFVTGLLRPFMRPPGGKTLSAGP